MKKRKPIPDSIIALFLFAGLFEFMGMVPYYIWGLFFSSRGADVVESQELIKMHFIVIIWTFILIFGVGFFLGRTMRESFCKISISIYSVGVVLFLLYVMSQNRLYYWQTTFLVGAFIVAVVSVLIASRAITKKLK